MLPFAAQPLAHCSATRMRSLVTFPSRSRLPYPEKLLLKPASSSSRLAAGDDHVTCDTRTGCVELTPMASGVTCGGSPAELDVIPEHLRQNDCSSQKALILCRAAACHVRRRLAFSHVRSVYSGRLKS